MVRKSPAAGPGNPPVDARQAAEAAFTYFYTLVPRLVRPRSDLHQVPIQVSPGQNVTEAVSDPSLEEIEMSKDERFWMVTLGYNAPRPKNQHLPEFLQVPMRKLKVFKVDAATGRVLSMKNPHDE